MNIVITLTENHYYKYFTSSTAMTCHKEIFTSLINEVILIIVILVILIFDKKIFFKAIDQLDHVTRFLLYQHFQFV